jgi:hypothetical protein
MKWWIILLALTGCMFAQNTPTIGVLPDNGPSLPAVCVIGQIYFRTATTIGLNQCNPANTWTALATASGSGTVSPNNGSAGAGAFYSAAGGSTTVSALSGLTFDTVGDATLAQGTITVSTPAFSQTGTWNAGGVAFTNWLSNITCTAAATASIAAGFGTAGTQWQFKYGAANCGLPQLLSPDGTGPSPAYAFSGATGTGMYRTAGNHIGMSISGTEMFDLGGTQGTGPLEVNAPICDWTNGNNCIFLTPNSIAVTGAGSPDGQIERGFNVNVTPVTVNANVTTDQNLMAVTVPANNFNVVGRTYRVFVAGVYSTAAASTAQMTLKVKICSVSGCASGNVASVISIQTTALGSVTVSNNAWNGTFYITTQTAGATGAWEPHGTFNIDLGAITAADSLFNDTNTATVAGSPSAIDTTAQNFVQISFAFSAASTSNSVTERQLVVEVVN